MSAPLPQWTKTRSVGGIRTIIAGVAPVVVRCGHRADCRFLRIPAWQRKSPRHGTVEAGDLVELAPGTEIRNGSIEWDNGNMEKPVGEECWRSPSDLVDAVSLSKGS
jgi:hypothetical protein